jgi:hypothetical protein
MAHREADAAVEELWDEFHGLVNMSSEELHRWLLADAAGENGAIPDGPDALSPEGRAVAEVLAKRKVDLTDDDLDAMRTTVEGIRRLLGARDAVGGAEDEQWRHDLMDLGHDPFKDERG